jgi:hypothetical protein
MAYSFGHGHMFRLTAIDTAHERVEFSPGLVTSAACPQRCHAPANRATKAVKRGQPAEAPRGAAHHFHCR